jgi:hypothetical protein
MQAQVQVPHGAWVTADLKESAFLLWKQLEVFARRDFLLLPCMEELVCQTAARRMLCEIVAFFFGHDWFIMPPALLVDKY